MNTYGYNFLKLKQFDDRSKNGLRSAHVELLKSKSAERISVKRITITIDGDIESALNTYVSSLEIRPSLTAVVQAALRQFLISKGQLRPSHGAGASRTESRRPPRRGR